MRVIVTGSKGQLGQDVVLELKARGITCLGADKDDFDITDKTATMQFITTARPDAVIHCAAYTAVDRAEDEPELCYKVNAEGTRHVAEACQHVQAKLLYVSTDYVFDGTGDVPWEVDAPTKPINVYGFSKLRGEEALSIVDRSFIVRISWVFGINGSNFVNTMLRLAERGKLGVVADQVGSPTYTKDLAPLLCDMVVSEKYGTYHATNEGYCSWYEFACAIFRVAKLKVDVEPLTTAQYPTKARRPLNSRLSKLSLEREGFHRLPLWQDALARYLQEMDLFQARK
jgi:dTDP-4-dehydrorhamnose reductase